MQRVLQVHLDRRMVVFAARAEVLLRPMPPRAAEQGREELAELRLVAGRRPRWNSKPSSQPGGGWKPPSGDTPAARLS